MGVVSRKWVWVEFMGVDSGCGCKEVYRIPHIIYPYYSYIYLLFFAAASLFLFNFKMIFFLVPVLFGNLFNTFFAQYKHTPATTGVPRKPYEELHIMFYTRISTHKRTFHIL